MRYQTEGDAHKQRHGSFTRIFCIGALMGASAAFLFAPRIGSELRGQVKESAGRLRRRASDTYRGVSGKLTDFVETGKQAYDRARHGVAGPVEQPRLGHAAAGPKSIAS